jgi:outer membrane protein, multidrug efflux system
MIPLPTQLSSDRRRWPARLARLCAVSLGLGCLALAGCTVGPDYQRPPLAMPAGFRGDIGASTNSLAELPWWEVFHDERLQALIRISLRNNYDLRIAATRVAQAQAITAQVRSQFYPQLNYGAQASRQKNVFPGGTPVPTVPTSTIVSANVNATWEIDLWGRVRRMSESAQAQYFATEEARRDLTISLIAQVADAYFQLLALDRQLAIAQSATNSFGQSLRLFNERLQGGVASKLETASAEALLASAAADIPDLQRQIVLIENQLSILLGENPGPITRTGADFDNESPPDVPPGLPSSLLERRPDIRQAEQLLRSANAQVGVAEANFYPQLNLTGVFGGVSPELSALSAGSTLAWGVAAGLTGPLFHGGSLKAQKRQALAVRDQYVLQYQSAVLGALQEVSSALISRQQLAEARIQQARAVAAYEEATRIALERYRRGQSSYYEVLQEQQQLFPAQRTLAQTQFNQLAAVVQLYRALGGGWQLESVKPR